MPCSHEHCRVVTEVDDRQGLSDVGSPLSHVILTQVHVLLAVVRPQGLHLLPMLLAVDEPTETADERPPVLSPPVVPPVCEPPWFSEPPVFSLLPVEEPF